MLVELSHVRNITADQGIIGRLLGFGDVGISFAGSDGMQVVFAGVARPAQIKELVRGQTKTASQS